MLDISETILLSSYFEVLKGETFDIFFSGIALKNRGRDRGIATSELRVFVVVRDSRSSFKNTCVYFPAFQNLPESGLRMAQAFMMAGFFL